MGSLGSEPIMRAIGAKTVQDLRAKQHFQQRPKPRFFPGSSR